MLLWSYVEFEVRTNVGKFQNKKKLTTNTMYSCSIKTDEIGFE